jgi:hypothetical protein
MWIRFKSQKPYAVQVFVGSINAISGKDAITPGTKYDEEDCQISQDYVIVPGQKWLDGVAVRPGLVRQFVATHVGSGRSIERQISGREAVAGLSFVIIPSVDNGLSYSLRTRLKDLTLGVDCRNYGYLTINASSLDTVDQVKSRIRAKLPINMPEYDLEVPGVLRGTMKGNSCLRSQSGTKS